MSDAELIALPKAEFPTVKWNDIEACQFNEDMCSGTRLAKEDYWGVLASLAFLHNESYNVYTHLVGALLLPLVALASLRYLADPQCIGVCLIDYAMLGIYFWCAETCLILSAISHLMQARSPRVERFWHGMDLLGMVIVSESTFSSGIYYVFSVSDVAKLALGDCESFRAIVTTEPPLCQPGSIE